MILPVVWSPTAKEEYALLLDYVETHFGTNAALKLLDKTEDTVERIAAFPNAFPASETRPDLHKAVITEQTSLLYRVTATQIQLLYFWDNRQDPERLLDLL